MLCRWDLPPTVVNAYYDPSLNQFGEEGGRWEEVEGEGEGVEGEGEGV